MATAKQIEANRLNAQKSTGPRSGDGKSISRLNATTHGLAAVLPETLTASEESQAEFESHKAMWRRELRPVGVLQEQLFEQVVVDSIRVERCQKTFFALCSLHAQRARDQWDFDRRLEAESLAAGLAKRPAMVAAKLALTPHGCDTLVSLWRGLKSSLERHRTWTENQRSLALDLLGIHPHLRDAETPIDPAEGDEYEARSQVVESEIARVISARERTLALDASERAMAEQTLGVEFTKPAQLIDRYERNAFRRYQLAWKGLQEAKRSDETAQPVAPAPITAPVAAKPIAAPTPIAPLSIAVHAPEPLARPYLAEPRPVPRNRQQRRTQAALERRA